MTDNSQELTSSSSPAPSASSTLVSGSPTSTWHAIRPWTPPLTLSVREVTSVSATFVLSASIAQSSDLDLDIDLENDLENDEQVQIQRISSIISDVLAKGLSVNVNGSPWQRVFIRIDDPADEAVIIIYGLMPGRQYDIDLGIVHGRHLRRQLATEDADVEPPSPSSPSAPIIAPVTNNPNVAVTSTVSQNATDTTTNPPAPPPFTIEDRLAQLNHTLSLLSSEREVLQSQIKTARRDGQKADAATRSEIEALKRASEKHTAAEARAKQKILALQEAVKRAQAGVRASEEQVAEIENSLPLLLKEKEQKEAEYQRVKKEAERARKERESADERDKKRLDKLRTELSALTHKLEKLNVKREKMEGGMMPEYEDQLRQTKNELESMEREEEELAAEELANASGLGGIGRDYSSHSIPRRRANTGGAASNPGPIGRPPRASDPLSNPISWSPTSLLRLRDSSSTEQHESLQVQRTPGHPLPRRDSNGVYSSPPGYASVNNPEQLQSVAPVSPSSSSSSSSPVGLHPPGLLRTSPTTLSTRAPAFEPLRSASYVAPIQRPGGATVTRSKSGTSAQSRHA